MTTFELVPAEIKAYRWMVNGDHPNDNSVDGSEGKVVRHFHSSDHRTGDVPCQICDATGDTLCLTCGIAFNLHGWIDTPMSAGYKVCPGDWIIADEVMSWKPMSPKKFAMTYQEVLL